MESAILTGSCVPYKDDSVENRSIGRNVRFLIDRKDSRHCFRLHRDRVYYLSEKMMRLAASFPRKFLISAGTCFGKFTKTSKFHLKVTCLEYLSQYAKVGVVLACCAPLPVLHTHKGRIG